MGEMADNRNSQLYQTTHILILRQKNAEKQGIDCNFVMLGFCYLWNLQNDLPSRHRCNFLSQVFCTKHGRLEGLLGFIRGLRAERHRRGREKVCCF